MVGNWAAVFVLEEEIEGGVVTFGEDNEWAQRSLQKVKIQMKV